MSILKAGIAAVFGDLPVAFWLAVAAIAGGVLWHLAAVEDARRMARLEIKAAIEAEAAKAGRQADAATRSVLACAGTWNRSAGRCEP
ncbi:hypothetical protein [Bosea sp. (in: a-proteobacteria)]|uniref:hypothetical protein n=1 Tax=Bosea sp. (in: a-proteobacteria) TaxID=1871050 RepID=UPI0026247228|nr:hypothetical protein [Bosea sp. (in: a-proteobacteria)]MCO5092006.1 hypothetical protein [Bosea sp. (in: a-proteobacteria)]